MYLNYVSKVVRSKEFLFSLPAVFVFLIVMSLMWYAIGNASEIESRYRTGAVAAMTNGELELAEVFYGRVLKDNPKLQPTDWLSYAQVLAGLGKSNDSMSILNQLAPDVERGFGPAHRFKAIELAKRLKKTRDADELEKLRHHLRYVGEDRSVEMLEAWSIYHLGVGEVHKALDDIEAITKKDPNLLPLAVQACLKYGDEGRGRKLAGRAIAVLEASLASDPFKHNIRISLSQMLVMIDRESEAEKTLLQGISLKNERKLRQATALFYTQQFQKMSNRGVGFPQLFQTLERALHFDPLCKTAYKSLISLYHHGKSAEEKASVKEQLLERIASGKGGAMAHFAISDLYAVENDFEQMQMHAEKAYQLDPSLTVVGNNLAWLLAHNDPPDLERALKVASNIVQASPSVPEFLDTLGTIQMKLGESDTAIVTLERALPKAKNKNAIHHKLATLYRQVGNASLADIHAKHSGSLDQ